MAREGTGGGRGAQAQGFYLGQERGGADLQARRAELVAEVEAAETAKKTSTERIKALNAEAQAGKDIDPEKYAELMNVLELAERNAVSFAEELKVLDSVMETAEDGTKKVARAVEGMGARQALEASRLASGTAGRPDISNYGLLRGATGAAVAQVGSLAGYKALQGAQKIPDLGFDVKRNEYFSKSQDLGKAEQDKLNVATNKLSVAQRNYFELLTSGEATVEQMNLAWEELDQAANKFANRIAKAFGGFAPTLGSLTGVHPLGEGQAYKSDEAPVEGPQYSDKTLKDESRRQAKRDQAEADRTRKVEQTAEAKAATSDAELARIRERRKEVEAARLKAVETAAKQEASLIEKSGAGGGAVTRALAAEQALARATQQQRLQDPYHTEGATSPAATPEQAQARVAGLRAKAAADQAAYKDARTEYARAYEHWVEEIATRPQGAGGLPPVAALSGLRSGRAGVDRLGQVAAASAEAANAAERRRIQGSTGGTAHLPGAEQLAGLGGTGRLGPFTEAEQHLHGQTINQTVAAAKKEYEDALKPLGGGAALGGLLKTREDLEQLDRELASLDTQEQKAVATAEKAGRAVEKKAKAEGDEAAETEKAVTSKKETAQATRELTAAEQARVATLQAEKAELAKVRPPGQSVKQLRDAADAAQRSASAQKGLATRYATSDPARSAAAAKAAESLQAEATALKEQATAAAEGEEGHHRDQQGAQGARRPRWCRRWWRRSQAADWWWWYWWWVQRGEQQHPAPDP